MSRSEEEGGKEMCSEEHKDFHTPGFRSHCKSLALFQILRSDRSTDICCTKVLNKDLQIHKSMCVVEL